MLKKHVNTAVRKLAKSAFITLAFMALVPTVAVADTADEIKALIMQENAHTRKNLSADSNGISKHGAVEFWSSGGLMQHISADSPAGKWQKFALTPKHIEVVTLVEDQAAVAMYYSEGSFHETGQEPVSHYMTRVTVAYVKEDGQWKERAAHYSPVTGGEGTRQTSLD